MRALLLLALLAAPVRAQDEREEGAPGVVHLVALPKVPKAEVQAYLEQANGIYEKLGVNLRVKLVKKPSAFDPGLMSPKSSLAVIGAPQDIQVYVLKKDPKNAKFMQGWSGVDEVERSQNDYAWQDKYRGGGRLILVDHSAVAWYAGLGGWTKEQAGGIILVHGTGHNSDLDGKLQHNEYAGIMTDGAIMQHQCTKAEKAFASFTSPKTNARLIAHLQSRYH